MFQVPDDSGFLASVVPATYQSFVAQDRGFELLQAHLRQQMVHRSLLIWGTGLEGFWRVDLRLGGEDVRGFREVIGPVRVVGGSVLVTSYDSLTMAAQYAGGPLPEAHERDQLVDGPDGDYSCRVVQMFDPERCSTASGESPDFVLVPSEESGAVPVWSGIPWFTDA